ncbi:ATP-grasp domain-containing protein [Bacillus sp. FJAT-44742]|uniref:ATP-grasp domain-containing protein n=1 Tax=Bacillus sp. FJAT-44742 TaxID=2014005 RepID=UPI000C243C47|nr:ATP-grasp domain-containing protein [Bacillus sp. FJAT-44742]
MNILLTSGARRIDFVEFFQQALKESGTLGNVIVADPDDNAPSLQVADLAYVIPTQTDDNYMDAIYNICEEHDIDVLIPLNDLEVPKISENKKKLEEKGITVICSDPDVVLQIRDKAYYRELLGKFGVKAPLTYMKVEEAKEAVENGEVEFPLIVKPRNGSASIGIEIVNTIEDLDSAYKLAIQKVKESPLDDATAEKAEDNIIIQDVVDGEKYSLDIVNDLDGNYLTAFARKQLAMRAGDVDRTLVTDEDEVLNLGRAIGNNLKHVGYLNTDVFYDGKDYYVIDMNPRFGGGYSFSHAAGANIPAAFVALGTGKKLKSEWLNSTPNMELARHDAVVEIRKEQIRDASRGSSKAK